MDTGWQSDEEVDYQSLDLPEGWSTDPEHPSRLGASGSGPKAWVVVTALVLVAVLVWWAIGRP